MSALDDLSASISAYPQAIRVARTEAGLSNAQLAERSGVPYSAICKVQSGLQNITLPQAAAICAILGLSLDALVGLPDTRPTAAANHEMDLKLSDKEGDVRVLEAVNKMLTLQLRRLRSCLYVTMVLCALLAIGLITYIVIDARIPYAGFIRSTGLSGGAWLFILSVIAAAVVMGVLLLRLSTKYTENHTERGKT
nr:MAG TPA: helix-turn-helix domain protein [Caudoviricetes sp.]